MLQTEFDFTLPMGYVDAEGNVHREGTMRLATAMDEVIPMRDPRVKSNEAYLTIMLLARVITRLGAIQQVNTGVIESLFTTDLTFLQDLYRRINESGSSQVEIVCPGCQRHIAWEPTPLGE
ncbi:MAG: phage tail assembly protein [Chloroflexi bacterium]|nr:phage tail assembly protein [Chloroflexota bacterium]